jgi:hypothetical protein
MKVVSVVPVANDKPTLAALLTETERRLRGKGTTFVQNRPRRWSHKRYPGQITWELAKDGILVAKVRSTKRDSEWQLLRAFIGYLDRHLGEYIDTITIRYYGD